MTRSGAESAGSSPPISAPQQSRPSGRRQKLRTSTLGLRSQEVSRLKPCMNSPSHGTPVPFDIFHLRRAMRSNKRPRPAGNHDVFRLVSFPGPSSSNQRSDPSSALKPIDAAVSSTPNEPSTSGSKIAIPRNSQTQSYGNRRVKRACIDCRDQKTKCNGQNPCRRCTTFGIPCVYVDGKREVTEKRLQDLERQVQVYDRLLQEIQPRVDSQDRDLISKTRAQVQAHLLSSHSLKITLICLVSRCRTRAREP